MKKTLSQNIKDQADRLRKFLATRDVSLSSSLALEGISRAVHGRPWNVVQALEPRRLSKQGVEAEVLTGAYFTYKKVDGTTAPLALVAHRQESTGAGVVAENINRALHELSDKEVLALFESPRNNPWLLLTGRRPAHPSEGAGALVLSGSDDLDAFAIWIAAFRPHLLLDYLSYRFYMGPKTMFKDYMGMGVAQDNTGDWRVVLPDTEVASITGADLQALGAELFADQQSAELALARALLGGMTSKNKKPWLREDLATLAVIPGSGAADLVYAKQSVRGRHCTKTGSTLLLKQGEVLSTARLLDITDKGKHYVDVVLQVCMDELLQGLDLFCDRLSELVVGNIVDLEDIGYEAAPVDMELPQPNANHIWLRVIGGWNPVDQDDFDTDSSPQEAVA